MIWGFASNIKKIEFLEQVETYPQPLILSSPKHRRVLLSNHVKERFPKVEPCHHQKPKPESFHPD